MAETEYERARATALEWIQAYALRTGTPSSLYSGQFDVEESAEFYDAWVFNWNSDEYLRTGEAFDQLLVGAIAVPKDGSPVFALGTAGSVVEELDTWRETRGRL